MRYFSYDQLVQLSPEHIWKKVAYIPQAPNPIPAAAAMTPNTLSVIKKAIANPIAKAQYKRV